MPQLILRRVAAVGLLIAAVAPAQRLFDFRSDFWINLHHFLYQEALANPPGDSGSAEWNSAVAYYRREFSKRDLLQDDGMVRIHNDLPDLTALPPDLAAELRLAAPVYRARWWTAQNEANLAWIHAVEPLIARYGDGLKTDLERIYQTPWPPSPIRTDVCSYASWAGAYTTLHPPHITVSSAKPENSGPAALEVLFHEASHALALKVSEALSSEAASQRKLFRRRAFWHAIVFYTAGELVQRRIDGYTPYAVNYSLYDRAWPGALPVLEKDWKPYIDGQIDLPTAVRRLVEDYGVPRP
jgi:hypothetical protein